MPRGIPNRKPQVSTKPQTLPVFLDYDTWVDGERIRAATGLAQNLPYDRARELINEGKARRADPLPGEE